MADKAISELIAANQVTPTDLFVLEQSGTAKKLTGQVLENWLVSFADGHGGIHSIKKIGTSELNDTYRITLADTTTFDFVVTNGIGINSITKIGTSGLVDTYEIKYNNRTSDTFTVTNGAKGDKGDNTYTHIKFASQEPTETSHSMGDVPDNWIGFYWGSSSDAPTDWTQYKWYQFKGDKGDTGSPATLTDAVVEYQVGNSGTVIPSEAWTVSVPAVAQGKYLWTRTTQIFNTGSPVVSYSVARMGLDGSGSVVSVNNISPNAEGNVNLTAEDVGARSNTWLPTPAEIGAAPARFGLNNDYKTTADPSVMDTYRTNGWYRYVNTVAQSLVPGFNIYYAAIRVDSYSENEYAVQTLFSIAHRDSQLVRYIKADKTWSEWEWVNPPMTAGTEYRTTERYQGKAVYTKLINCGTPVNASGVNHGASINVPIRINVNSPKLTARAVTGTNYYLDARLEKTALILFCGSEIANKAEYNAYAQIWYTKD